MSKIIKPQSGGADHEEEVPEIKMEDLLKFMQSMRQESMDSRRTIEEKLEEHSKATEEKFKELPKNFEEKLSEISRIMEQKLPKNMSEKSAESFCTLSENANTDDPDENLKTTQQKNLDKYVALDTKLEEISKTFDTKILNLEKYLTKNFEKCVEKIVNLEKHLEGIPKSTVAITAKLPTYDGTVPWFYHKIQLEAVAVANGWSDGNKVTALVTSLRGKALRVLEDWNAKQSYKTLSSFMEWQFP